MKNPQKRQDKKSTVPSSEVEITWNAEWHILPRLLQKVRAPSVHRTLGAMADIWHPTSGDSAVADRKPIFSLTASWSHTTAVHANRRSCAEYWCSTRSNVASCRLRSFVTKSCLVSLVHFDASRWFYFSDLSFLPRNPSTVSREILRRTKPPSPITRILSGPIESYCTRDGLTPPHHRFPPRTGRTSWPETGATHPKTNWIVHIETYFTVRQLSWSQGNFVKQGSPQQSTNWVQHLPSICASQEDARCAEAKMCQQQKIVQHFKSKTRTIWIYLTCSPASLVDAWIMFIALPQVTGSGQVCNCKRKVSWHKLSQKNIKKMSFCNEPVPSLLLRVPHEIGFCSHAQLETSIEAIYQLWTGPSIQKSPLSWSTTCEYMLHVNDMWIHVNNVYNIFNLQILVPFRKYAKTCPRNVQTAFVFSSAPF